jgi:hypothetical protein
MGISYMSRRQANTAILAGAAVLVAAPASATQETEPIALPPPRSAGGKPLIEALMLRRSTREYSERPLPLQVLSDLLWAAPVRCRPVAAGTINAERAHGERMQDISPQERRLYALVDSGFIGQNVYLFCASEGLGTVFRGAVDYDKLSRAMQLGTDQFVTFAQTVGYLWN